MLYDRRNGNVAVCPYRQTRGEVLEADRILSDMSPTRLERARLADIYEGAMDMATR